VILPGLHFLLKYSAGNPDNYRDATIKPVVAIFCWTVRKFRTVCA